MAILDLIKRRLAAGPGGGFIDPDGIGDASSFGQDDAAACGRANISDRTNRADIRPDFE